MVAVLGREEGRRQVKGWVRAADAVSRAGDHRSDTGSGAQESSAAQIRALVSPKTVTPEKKRQHVDNDSQLTVTGYSFPASAKEETQIISVTGHLKAKNKEPFISISMHTCNIGQTTYAR